MKKIAKYIGAGLLCAVGAVSMPYFMSQSASARKELKVVIDYKTQISYIVTKGELRGPFGRVISPRNNGIVRYQQGVPGWTQINMYKDCTGERIHIRTFNAYSEEMSCIDEVINSEKVKDEVMRFEQDIDLLKRAGLIE